jgi:hypothetical protein
MNEVDGVIRNTVRMEGQSGFKKAGLICDRTLDSTPPSQRCLVADNTPSIDDEALPVFCDIPDSKVSSVCSWPLFLDVWKSWWGSLLPHHAQAADRRHAFHYHILALMCVVAIRPESTHTVLDLGSCFPNCTLATSSADWFRRRSLFADQGAVLDTDVAVGSKAQHPIIYWRVRSFIAAMKSNCSSDEVPRDVD